LAYACKAGLDRGAGKGGDDAEDRERETANGCIHPTCLHPRGLKAEHPSARVKYEKGKKIRSIWYGKCTDDGHRAEPKRGKYGVSERAAGARELKCLQTSVHKLCVGTLGS
jgi:hypothetical protein